MKDIFRSETIPIWFKTDIWQASCLSILLYGCENLIITKKLENSLNSFATSWSERIDKVSNIRIHELIYIKDPLVLTVQRRQLRFVGRCLRKAENELINKYVLYTPELSHGNRGRGQPKMLYPRLHRPAHRQRNTTNDRRHTSSSEKPPRMEQNCGRLHTHFVCSRLMMMMNNI